MQNHLQNHFKFEFEFNAYGCFALFTQFKLVKHENRAHIHNPWIFLIFLDILFIKFGVRNKKLFNFQILLIFWNFLDYFISFNCFVFLLRHADLSMTWGGLWPVGPHCQSQWGLTPLLKLTREVN